MVKGNEKSVQLVDASNIDLGNSREGRKDPVEDLEIPGNQALNQCRVVETSTQGVKEGSRNPH